MDFKPRRSQFTSTIATGLWESVSALAYEHRLTKSKLVDEAFIDLLKKYGYKNQ